MDQGSHSQSKQLLAGLAVLIVIVAIVAGGAVAAKHKDEAASAGTAISQTSATTTSGTAPSSSATYKDGSYTATAEYGTPGGVDSMSLNLTVQNGLVSSVSATTQAPDHESQQYDSRFLSSYKQFVVGKSIGSINASRISGASLTTQGFNNALQKIASQAQA